MDMNQLFHDHQIALMKAARARRRGLEPRDPALSRRCADRIEAYRARRGMDAYFVQPLTAGCTSGR